VSTAKSRKRKAECWRLSIDAAAASRRCHARRPPFRTNASNLPRRQFLHLAAGSAALPATTRLAWAQAYPTRPITMIAPSAAGSPSDLVGRVLAEQMRGFLGQPIIIENVSGANGSIGVGRAARARPDGYTIDVGFVGTHVLNGAFYSLPYDLLNDFAPIVLLGTAPDILFARKTMPAKDLKELIGWLMTNPNKASAGNFGAGFQLLTALFEKLKSGKFSFLFSRS
jgi:tripartite-type tricarboxylate transporter receptor subunit TctC